MPGRLVVRWRRRCACHLCHCRLLVPRVKSDGDHERMRRGLLWYICHRVDSYRQHLLWRVHGCGGDLLPRCVNDRCRHRVPGGLVVRWRRRPICHLRRRCWHVLSCLVN